MIFGKDLTRKVLEPYDKVLNSMDDPDQMELYLLRNYVTIENEVLRRRRSFCEFYLWVLLWRLNIKELREAQARLEDKD